MFTSVFSGLTPYIPVLLAVAVVIAVVLIAFRVKRDGLYTVFFESADQRWKRHADYRMSQWAKRDHQRQRFHAAMVTRANNTADDRYAARNPAVRGASSRQANTSRTPARHDTTRATTTAAVTRPAVTSAPDTTLTASDDIPPDIANPFMTQQDWIAYLTLE